MDYYYSLLESYQQLKRRKFKLSLREQEEDGDNAEAIAVATNDSKAAIEDALNKGPEFTLDKQGNSGNLTVKNITKGTNKMVTVYGGNLGRGVTFYQKDIEGGKWSKGAANETHKTAKVIAAWAGGGEKEGAGPAGGQDGEGQGEQGGEGQGGPNQQPGQEEPTVDERVKALGFAVRNRINNLLNMEKGSEDTPAINAFPGLRRETKHTKRPESLAGVARGKNQGFRASSADDIPETAINSTHITAEQRETALEGLDQTMEALELLHQKGWSDPKNITADGEEKMSEEEARKIGEVLSRMRVTRHGVLIDGVSFFYSSDSTAESDALRNTAEQLNDAVKVYNSQFDTPEGGEEDPRVSELDEEPPPPPKNGGAKESYRGPVAEKFMKISGILIKGEARWEEATTDAEKKKVLEEMNEEIYEVYEDAMDDGSWEDLLKTFAVGRSVILGEKLATLEDLEGAAWVEGCEDIMVNDLGMDEQKAKEMLDIAGQTGDRRQLMMAMMVTTLVNQSMDRELFGDDPELVPDSITHAGDTDATSSGQKADLVFEWSAEKCKAIKKAYEKKLGKTPTGDGGGCMGKGTGMDQLLTQDEETGTCRMEVELKTLTSASESGGGGELSQSRMQSVCDDAPVIEGETFNPKTGKTMSTYEYEVLVNKMDPAAGMSPATRDFADRNKERMTDCVSPDAEKNACKKLKDIQKKTEKFTKLLTPGTPGVTQDQRDLMLDTWWSQKRQDADGKARYDAAKRALRDPAPGKKEHDAIEDYKRWEMEVKENPDALEPPQPDDKMKAAAKGYTDDLKQLKKVKDDLAQLVYKREIHRTQSGAGFTMKDGEATTGEESGTITDQEWVDYFTYNYTMAVGTTEETLRVTRGVDDGYQSVYLNNATMQENLRKLKAGEAEFTYEQGGTIVHLKDKETGRTLAKLDTGRGGNKWVIPKDQKEVISEPRAKQKKAPAKKKPAEENLMMDFLQGQQALLEKLIGQTT
jgi:hypothetical protein